MKNIYKEDFNNLDKEFMKLPNWLIITISFLIFLLIIFLINI
jgi:hypothetical protein